METIYLNQTLSNSQGDVNKVISDLKQDNNCLIAEIENLKLQLMYNNTNNSNHIDYNKEYHSYSRKEDVKNMKDVISDMKRNKLQIKQEIKKHFSNNNSNNNSNVVMQRDGVITEYNDEEDSQGDNVKYKMLFVLILLMVIITGCGKKEKDKILICRFPNTTITLTIRDGKIIKYIDDVQGEFSFDKIEQLNDEYLENINDNKDAYIKLREVIASTGGDCQN
jgi:hypothetical protein